MSDSKSTKIYPSGSLGVTKTPYVIKPSPRPRWEMTINGGDDLKFRLHVAPNRFHRFMQKLVLGFNWKELKDE